MRKSFTRKVLTISLLCAAISLPVLAHPHDRLEWAISDGQHQTIVSTSRRGQRAVARLERKLDVPFIWLRHEGRDYVITDEATIRKARAIFEDLPDIEDLELLVEIDTDGLEEEIEREIESRMEDFEDRMADIEERIETGSFAAIRDIEEAVSDLELDRIAEITARIEERVRDIEIHTDRIEDWADDLQERIEDEAIPLLEDAIESGLAKPVR